jgi:hypothetical protein
MNERGDGLARALTGILGAVPRERLALLEIQATEEGGFVFRLGYHHEGNVCYVHHPDDDVNAPCEHCDEVDAEDGAIREHVEQAGGIVEDVDFPGIPEWDGPAIIRGRIVVPTEPTNDDALIRLETAEMAMAEEYARRVAAIPEVRRVAVERRVLEVVVTTDEDDTWSMDRSKALLYRLLTEQPDTGGTVVVDGQPVYLGYSFWDADDDGGRERSTGIGERVLYRRNEGCKVTP